MDVAALPTADLLRLRAELGKYSADQPREPAGTPEGGRFAGGAGGGDVTLLPGERLFPQPAADAGFSREFESAYNWINQQYGPWFYALSPQQRDAIRNYSTFKYQVINGVLRGQVPDAIHYRPDLHLKDQPVTPEDVRQARADAAAMSMAIERAPGLDQPTVVFRTMSADQIPGLRPGDTFTDKGFVSTSILRSHAEPAVPIPDAVTVAIHLPEGTRVGHPDVGTELVLQAGSTFRVNAPGDLSLVQSGPLVYASTMASKMARPTSDPDRYHWAAGQIEVGRPVALLPTGELVRLRSALKSSPAFIDRARRILLQGYADAAIAGDDAALAAAEDDTDDDLDETDPAQIAEDEEDPDEPDQDPDDEGPDVEPDFTEQVQQAVERQQEYLTGLAAILASGGLTDAMMAVRAGLYAASLNTLFEQGFSAGVQSAPTDPGTTWIVTWITEGDGDVCQLCASRDGQVWPIDGDYPYPGEGYFGEQCEGGPNCRCALEYAAVDAADATPADASPADVTAVARPSLVERLPTDALLRLVASLRKFDPSEPRDERGQWTSDGGAAWGDPGANPREPMPADITSWPNDRAIAWFDANRDKERAWSAQVARGVALGRISPSDAQARGWDPNTGGRPIAPLPDTLYHATAARDAVLRDGLKTGEELQARGVSARGLGWMGGVGSTISLTTDRAYAERIAEVLTEAHDVATGAVTPADLAARAAAGGFDARMRTFYETTQGGGAYDRLQQGVERATPGYGASTLEQMLADKGPGWTPDPAGNSYMGGDNAMRYTSFVRPSTADESQQHALDLYRAFTLAQSEAGGPTDPVLTGSDPKYLASLDPSQIGVVEAHPTPGATGYYVGPAEAEWRTWTGDALTVSAVKGVTAWLRKYSPDQPREPAGSPEGGEFASAGGGDIRDEAVAGVLRGSDYQRRTGTLRHYTDTTPRISHTSVRLIPDSISTQQGSGLAGLFGEKLYYGRMTPGARVLDLTRAKWNALWDATPKDSLATNAQMGAAVARYARANGYDAVRVAGSIHGLGTEIAVLNPDAITFADEAGKPVPLQKYSADEPRDEGGRWTSDGGEAPLYVGVPASAIPVGTDIHYGPPRGPDWRPGDPELTQRSGAPIRGETVISPSDPRIPDTVYHVTTNLPAVEASGRLLAGGKGGLGGDAQDRIVSMTIDRGIATQLADDLRLNAAAEASPEPWKVFTAQAQAEGWGDKWLTGSRLFNADGSPVSWLGYRASDWSTAYFNQRDYAGTGQRNPVIFENRGAPVDPANVGVVSIPRDNLDNGSLLVDFDLARGDHGLQEIRSYGDVPLTGATYTKAAMPAIVKYSDAQPRVPAGGPGGGEFAGSAALREFTTQGATADDAASNAALDVADSEDLAYEAGDVGREWNRDQGGPQALALQRAAAAYLGTPAPSWAATGGEQYDAAARLLLEANRAAIAANFPLDAPLTVYRGWSGSQVDRSPLLSYTTDRGEAATFGHVETRQITYRDVAGMPWFGLGNSVHQEVVVYDRPPASVVKYSDTQPREPAGTPEGGRFAGGAHALDIGADQAEEEYRRTAANLYQMNDESPTPEKVTQSTAAYLKADVAIHLGDALATNPAWRAQEPHMSAETWAAASRAFVDTRIAGWASTSGDTNGAAVAMQLSAEHAFGIAGAAHPWDTSPALLSSFDPSQPGIRANEALLREMYTQTQADLAAHGIDGMYVYRGSSWAWDDPKGDALGPFDGGTHVGETTMQPLSSWSINPSTAADFTSYDPLRNSRIDGMWIPADRIVSTPRTGFGCANEGEVVVLGGTYQTTYQTSEEGDMGPMRTGLFAQPAKAAAARPDRRAGLDDVLANADWPKRTWDVHVPAAVWLATHGPLDPALPSTAAAPPEYRMAPR